MVTPELGTAIRRIPFTPWDQTAGLAYDGTQMGAIVEQPRKFP